MEESPLIKGRSASVLADSLQTATVFIESMLLQRTRNPEMTALYIIVRIGYEYDDSCFFNPMEECGHPVKAYRSRNTAQSECTRRNKSESKYADMFEDNGKPIKIFYKVVEIEEGEEAFSAQGKPAGSRNIKKPVRKSRSKD